MLTWILVFLASLAVLLFSAGQFTKAAEKIGVHIGFSPFIIGVFIIGIGTSLPELISAFLAVSGQTSEIVAGNILGSNISNIFLISGLAAVISKKRIDLGSQYILIDLHFMMGSVFLLGLMMLDGEITLAEGLFLLACFIIYTTHILRSGYHPEVDEKHEEVEKKAEQQGVLVPLLILLATGIGIYFGADYTVLSIGKLAELLGVPPSVISLTALSLGTTLPELSVNISAIRSGKAEMAIGNVLGSCVFNALAIPGAVTWIGSIRVPESLLHFSLPVWAVASLFFYLLTLDKKISAYEGMLFVLFYLFFLFKVATTA